MFSTQQYFGFDPRTIPGCRLWLDAADSRTTQAPVSALTQWNDKSGNGYNMVPYSIYSNATISSNYQNGLNVINFNGSNIYQAPVNSATYPLDAYIVIALKSPLTRCDVLTVTPSNVDNFNSLTFSEYTSLRWHNGSTGFSRTPNTVSPSNETSSNFLIMNWSIANNNFVIRRNTTQLSQTASYTWTMSNNTFFQIGFRAAVALFGLDVVFNAFVGEIIVFDSQLTTNNRQSVEGYLAWKWGLQASLPTGHPYKSNPNFQRIPTPLDFGPLLFWWDAADYGTFTPANPTNGTSITGWRDKVSGLTLSNSNASPTWSSNGVVFTNASSTVSTSTQNLLYSNVSSPYRLTQNTTLIVAHSPNLFTNFRSAVYINAPAAFNVNPSFFLTTGNGATEGSSVGTYNGAGTWLSLQQAASVNTGAGNRRIDTLLSQPSNFIWVNGTEGSYTVNNIGRGTSNGGTAVLDYISMSTTSNVSGNRAYDGTIHEVLVYSSNLSSNAIRQVEGYLAWKWNTRPNLVTTHPFFSIPTSSPLFVPSTLSNLGLWLDGADSSTITGTTTVTAWNDKSGNGRNATTTSNHPSYTPGTNYIQFSGSNWMSVNFTFLVNTQYTLFYAVKRESSKVENFFMSSTDTTTNANLHIGFSPDTATIKYAQWANQVSPNPTTTAYTGNTATEPNNLYSFQQTSNQRIVYVNGSNISATTNTSLVSAQNDGLLGVYFRSPITSFQGRFYEVVMFTRALSTAERQQVEGYLAWKYNFQQRLATTHPYYKFRP